MDKFELTENEYVCLTKAIAAGAGIGIALGAIVGNVILGFSAGGVLGIIGSLIYSYSKRLKKNSAHI